MSEAFLRPEKDAAAMFAGRIDILYALGRHYLSLPFAVLCVPATLIAGHHPSVLPLIPFMLQITVVIAAERLTTAYKKRPRDPANPCSDPRFWAQRYTFVSAISGATWGVASLFWFVQDSFAAQAYLAMAFLGMTATEFIARSAHRPAYLVHTVFALGPLVGLLLREGGVYADCAAVLLVLFAAVLISYCHGMARLLDESVHLRNENAQLVKRLRREKGEALNARDAAEATSVAKSVFIANISHELRTPLNALLGMAQLLERADLTRQQADHVKVMLQAGYGLQTLIDDVIALTRDDDGQSEEEDCDPMQAARAVVRVLQPRAWEKRLQLSLSGDGGLPRVAADPRKVRQVLLKLTDNALKFTERGLVEIQLELADDGQAVRFCVSDTGRGVAPGMADLLFNPFSLGDTSYARKEQGAGLGLAVAKRVVEQAGGTIGYSSKLGEGAQFFFSLPLSGSTPVVTLREPENRQAAPSGLSLLLYLHSRELNDALIRLLEPFGNRLYLADSMAEATERAGKDPFDAIIVGAADADLLAAAPGVQAPLVAVMLRGDRAPSSTGVALRWPVEPDQLYRALNEVRLAHGPAIRETDQAEVSAAIDAETFSTLERSVGVKTLVEILQCYVVTAEQLTEALSEACAREGWDEAARLAQDIVGAAGGLGLTAITQAARHFAQAAREGRNRHDLRNAAQMVVGEHVRARNALAHLYPEVA